MQNLAKSGANSFVVLGALSFQRGAALPTTRTTRNSDGQVPPAQQKTKKPQWSVTPRLRSVPLADVHRRPKSDAQSPQTPKPTRHTSKKAFTPRDGGHILAPPALCFDLLRPSPGAPSLPTPTASHLQKSRMPSGVRGRRYPFLDVPGSIRHVGVRRK